MGDRNVPDRNKVFFGIPNVDTNVEVSYARDEAIKDLELNNRQLREQVETLVQQQAPAEAPNIIGGLAIEAFRPTGIPANGLLVGSGIFCIGSQTLPKNTTCVFDRNGTLGLGSNVYIGFRQNDDASTSGSTFTEVIAYQPQTSAITSLGSPISAAVGFRTFQMLIVGSSLYLKQADSGSFTTIYRWSSGSGWSTVSGSGLGYMSKMVLGGVENLVTTSISAGVRRMGYIDPAFPDTMIGSTTLGSNVCVTAKNSYLWRSDGYRATAAASPTWTQVVPSMSYETEFGTGRVDIDYSTGTLGVLRRFGAPAAFGVEAYNFTNGLASIAQNLWTATGAEDDGEPRTTGIRLYYDSYLVISGYLSEDYYESTTGSTEYYPAVWLSDGITTTLTHSDPSGLSAANPPDPFVMAQVDRDATGIIIAINYGLEAPGGGSTSTLDVLLL